MQDREIPKSGELYQHFKGNLYQIIAIARHTETYEQMVIYQALYGDYGMYARPLSMFLSVVDHEKYPEVTTKYRFTKISRAELKKETQVEHYAPIQSKELNQKSSLQSTFHQIKENMASNNQNIKVLSSTIKEDNSKNGQVNEDLMEFLDAADNTDKLEVLNKLRSRMNERLLGDIEASLDMAVGQGTFEERIEYVIQNLTMLARFETRRLR